jgi:FkbM family methyltransferase
MSSRLAWSNALKSATMDLGLYRPARWLFDNVISHNKRQLQQNRMRLFRSFVRAGDLCFDVGANKGDYSAALRGVGARVVAIEPQPSCLRELNARFRGDNFVNIVSTAVGAERGTETFYVREISGHSGLVKDWIGTNIVSRVQVPVCTLEELFAEYGRPRYIKIDVEGYESAVFAGLKSAVDLISMEYHLLENDVLQKLTIIERLSEISPLSFNLLVDGADSFWWSNFVDSATFRETFPAKLAEKHSLGDIFIAMS